MDGFSSSAEGRVVVMAASNLLDKLDPALLRPGRFDRQVFVSPPDVKGRERILRVHTANKPLRDDVDLYVVAQQTSGLTGADLANICNEAAIFCGRREGHAVSRADFDDALERVIAGVQSSTTLNDHERRVVAFHEAGHALCRELLDGVDRVHKISIVPRGSALGYVVNLPDEDSYLKTREELVDQMTVLLGGRVAEQIVFGAVTTGAASDLQRVEEITHAMIHQYAMGSGDAPQAALKDQALSDLTRRIRDEEQRELAFEAHRGAWDLITTHRELLDRIAAELLENETLERAQIDRIMEGVPRIERRRPAAGPAHRRGGEARRSRPTRLPARMFARVDHIGVAVEDLDAAIALHEAGLRHGRRAPRGRRGAGRRGRAARRRREPRRAAAPAERGDARSGASWPSAGPGLHHVAYQVADVEATLDALRERGLRLIDEQPRTGIRGSRVAFLHPAVVGRRAHRDRPAAGGTLTPWPSASASASRPAPRSPCG